jgi:hypothetical protein
MSKTYDFCNCLVTSGKNVPENPTRFQGQKLSRVLLTKNNSPSSVIPITLLDPAVLGLKASCTERGLEGQMGRKTT